MLIDSAIHRCGHKQSLQWHSTLAALLMFCLLFALAQNPAHAETQHWVYTVRPGDNIWALTEKYCTSVRYWKRIQRLNNVRLDRQIPPGTKLRFPLDILKYQPATALVAQVQGTARLIRTGSKPAVPLAAKTSLRSGDRIVTSAGANVTLQFADGSELLVLEDSEVVMDTLSAWGTTGMVDTRIRLQGGRVDTRVKPGRGPGSRYQIITPAAVAAVRGTHFRVAADKHQPLSRSEVTEGTVKVGDAKNSQDIPAGFGLVSESGKPPQPPRQLLPPPDLSAIARLYRSLPLQFSWSPLQGAQGYRLQIAPDQNFETLFVDKSAEQPSVQWADLPDGHYALRIRGIDGVGLEGLDSVGVFEVDARPFAPLPTGMNGGTLVRESTPDFSWEAVEGVQSYRFELARDAAFTQMVTRSQTDSAGIGLTEALQSGDYHWRVASVDPDGDQGPFSQPQHFSFRPPLAAPASVEAPIVEDATLVFTWRAVEHATAYRIQLAEDPAFARMVTDIKVSEPRAEIKRPPSRTYYFRISAENAQAEVGPHTQTREIKVPPHHYWGLLILLLPLLLAL
jgi:hypothetical protein